MGDTGRTEDPAGPLRPRPGSWRTVMRWFHPGTVYGVLWVLFLGALLVFVAVRFIQVLLGYDDPIW